ncbi:hypothetical protein ADEAN_000957900 [Angomonas deanei]|uniref:Uncharacterized protein n=1 Tax=Angomonas deanei TaxID=59799 RepID=A0A7G2CQJ2_9TRYP|nr:hypothetical protein ADEAN_000957900 [Angomonas deanei]
MGHSAKITRGGNKKRINQARRDAKLKAQGVKTHSSSMVEVAATKKALKQRAQALSEQLKKSKSQNKTGTTVVRMAPKPAKK